MEGAEARGVFECFNCGERAVLWMNDLPFDECEVEGEGVVRELHCTNCNADILYYVSLEEDK